jgi:polysaccharide pyruvyl transferase WcaK-like protein
MTDLILQGWVSSAIELTQLREVSQRMSWRPGEKLKLLFAGYNGARNFGSDVRVQEMLRQFRHVLGSTNVELTVTTLNFERTHGYFGDANQVRLPNVFPPFLYREVQQHHGVIACEGSMFKSKFSNALTTMMIGALGMAAAGGKLSIGYGAEAGPMSPSLKRMCRKYCAETLVITRNAESQATLSVLGIASVLGTDTAWTFEPLGPEYGREALMNAGWDGKTPVLILCPVHPFFWPVKASLAKFAASTLLGAYRDSQYRGPYFHASGRDIDAAYQHYIRSLVNATKADRQTHKVFPVVVACEAIDERACREVAERIGGAPLFSSEQQTMHQLVSILRSASYIVSSRYHALVTTMPSLVPSAGVSIDERIVNLMHDRKQSELLLIADDPQLESKLVGVLQTLSRDGERIRAGIADTVAKNLALMGQMGMTLEAAVQRKYPEFPARQSRSWKDYLPPMSPALHKILESRFA